MRTQRTTAAAVIIPDGKHIQYNRESRDFSAFYNGQLLGSRDRREDAQALADQHVHALLSSQEPQQ